MGNSASTQALRTQISRSLPIVSHKFSDGPKVFCSNSDREQFIAATLTVITRNGDIPLHGMEVELLFSRNDRGRLVARLVLQQYGILYAKIEAVNDGIDQKEAFNHLRKVIEQRLEQILQNTPHFQYNHPVSAENRAIENPVPVADGAIARTVPAADGAIARTVPAEDRAVARPVPAEDYPAERPPPYYQATQGSAEVALDEETGESD